MQGRRLFNLLSFGKGNSNEACFRTISDTTGTIPPRTLPMQRSKGKASTPSPAAAVYLFAYNENKAPQWTEPVASSPAPHRPPAPATPARQSGNILSRRMQAPQYSIRRVIWHVAVLFEAFRFAYRVPIHQRAIAHSKPKR